MSRHKDEKANPPGYRKHGDTRPKSTVTFKEDGFKHDPENNRVRLSKGSNLKEHFSDFLLCEYQTRPDVDLSEVNSVQNVRAVWNGDEWELHFVCKIELETTESAGDGIAGIDLGITNIATVAFPDEYVLYPGNSLKEDKHYFTREEYQTESENGPSKRAQKARQKLSRRKDHFLHTLSKHIVERCVEEGVEKIALATSVTSARMRTASRGIGVNRGINYSFTYQILLTRKTKLNYIKLFIFVKETIIGY